eukprot:4949163-Amphidinium_carterae.2
MANHYHIHSVGVEGFINKVQISRSQINTSLPGKSHSSSCGSDLVNHQKESDPQHADDVSRTFDMFDP